MSRIESARREVLRELAEYFEDAIKLKTLVYGFPESNRKMRYPAMAIHHAGTTQLAYELPYVLNQTIINGAMASVRYVHGQYNWKIQIDIWEESQEELFDLMEKFTQAFDGNLPQNGINLTLSEYHGVICTYVLTDEAEGNNQESAQRKEYRATYSIEANCKKVSSQDHSLITEEPEVTLETPEEIPTP